MFLGGLEFVALKWVGGHITSALATHLAHASVTTVGHFAATATTNVLTSAAGAGSTLGSLQVLGSGAYAGYKLTNLVEQHKLADETASEEEKLQTLIFIVSMMLAERYYAAQEHRGKSGGSKTELMEMEPCSAAACDCKDYNANDSKCAGCGHYSWQHSKITEETADDDSIAWLFHGMAADIYPLLHNRNGDNNLKTSLNEIDTCSYMDCPCWDFDMSEENTFLSRRCACGHKWREHVYTGQWEWIIHQLAIVALQQTLEDDN